MRFKLRKVTMRGLHVHLAEYTHGAQSGRRYRILYRDKPIAAIVPICDIRALHAIVRLSDDAFLDIMSHLLRDSGCKEDRRCVAYLTAWKDQFNCDQTKPMPELIDEE